MLGLAGRWGRRTRCWLPLTLAWVGSGSLAAFDGLNLVLGRLIGFGFGGGASPWGLYDTVQVVEVATGVLAAAVAAAVITGASAARPGGTSAGAPSPPLL
jgi:hypothetical protein